MPSWLEPFAANTASGVGGVGIGALVMWLANFIGGRMDRRAAALDAGTQRLIQQLEARTTALAERVDKVERELTDCQKKHAESEAKAMRLEAMLLATRPGMKLAFPPDKTLPVDMAVMAANLDGDDA